MKTNLSYILRDILGVRNRDLIRAYRAEGMEMEQAQVSKFVKKGIMRYDTAVRMTLVLKTHFGYEGTPQELIGYRG